MIGKLQQIQGRRIGHGFVKPPELKSKPKQEAENMKAFIVNSKDLLDKKKNPKLSLSVADILNNPEIPKTPIEAENDEHQEQ